MKVTNEMVHAAYEVAKKVHNDIISAKEGVLQLVKAYGMNESVAIDLINNFKYMMKGGKYSRTLNAYATDYYLRNIQKDFGKSALKIALQALKSHMDYYKKLTNTPMKKHTHIYQEFINVQ